MRKNTASQVIGAQMVSAADGSAFTGSVTVAVTGDGGTQATGSVGSGACTHKGGGYHTYAPAQAETNYNLVAFTFSGTGAVPVTVQVYTESINRHDTVRLGLTALPNAAADAAGGLPISDAGGQSIDVAVTQIGAIHGKLPGKDYIAGTDNVDGNIEMSAAIGNFAGSVASVTGAVGSVTAGVTVTTNNDKTGYGLSSTAVQAIWDALTSALTTTGSIGKKLADMVAQTGDAFARLGAPAGASVSADIAAAKTVVDAITAKTTNLPAAPAATGDIPTAAQNADAVWDEVLSGHATSGTAGAALSTASTGGVDASVLADAIWDEALSGHSTSGTAGKALTDASSLLSTALADAYAAHGNAPTLQQAIMWIHQSLDEASASGTTITIKKIDGTTAGTRTVNDATDPTSVTRAT